MRKCSFCKKDISSTHKNTKFCSSKCVDKKRYALQGQRTTAEYRSFRYRERLKNPEYKEKLNKQARDRSIKIKTFLAEYKIKKGCADCGYNKHHVALDFDHVTKNKKINVCLAKSIDQAKSEIEKCEVVCSNCHRIRTIKRLYPCKPDVFEATYEKVEDEL